MSSTTLDTLVGDLVPVRRLRPWHGLALIAAAFLLAVAAMFWLGLRPNAGLLFLHPFGIGRAALLAAVAVAASAELAVMARPRVGRGAAAWKWALGAALAMPALALAYGARQDRPLIETMAPQHWGWCLATIAVLALAIAGFVIAWLRRTAPTDLPRAGWLTGLAAGSLGGLAYSLHCPHNGIAAIAIWYSLAVAGCAVAGRLLVPPLIRW
jgi:hypothetical protein